ncbi:MAG: NHL repeat-containing protein [Anaerolineales bacterium]
MKAKAFSAIILLVALALILIWGVPQGSAQGPDPTPTPIPRVRVDPPIVSLPVWDEEKLFHPPSAARASTSQAVGPAVALGQPGTSFRYVETFGVAEEAYPSDTDHLNAPGGIFIDESDNLYVAENRGYRVLKYDSDGDNVIALGKAGLCYTAEDVFCAPSDVTLDGGGYIWVADGNRVIEYSSGGTFMQQMPEENAWQSGDDNTHFDNVTGIAFDSAGKMYVADENNHRVQVYASPVGVRFTTARSALRVSPAVTTATSITP